MQPANQPRPVQPSHSDKLQSHRRLLIVHGERQRRSSYERSSSPLDNINFISSRNIPPKGKLTSNTNREHSRKSEDNSKSLGREYNRMLKQSIGKVKQHSQERTVQHQPRNIRAASFVSRILDRSGRSGELRRSVAEELDSNWRESLILEINHNDGFIPVAKAKKASFFEAAGKRTPNSQPQPARTTLRTKRQFDDYLEFIRAKPGEQLRPTETFDELRKSKKVALSTNRKIVAAVLRLLQLAGRVLLNEEAEVEQRHRFLVEYSHLYFTLTQKIELEVVLCCSLLHGFRCRLREVFLLTRMFMLTVLTLSLEQRLFSKAGDKQVKLHQFCLLLEECYGILQDVVAEMCQAGSSADSVFTLSFRILRSMYSMEKNCDELKQLSKDMHSNQLLSSRASIDIERHLVYLLHRWLNSSTFQEKLLKSEMVLGWRYLRIPPTPYLPANGQPNQITLVLDLEETLVCNDAKGNCVSRPQLKTFLTAFHQQFELVVFACGPKPQSDRLLEHIDPNATFFRYRLYREHMSICEGKQYKDLTKLGRDLTKVLAVDDDADNLRYSPDNGISVPCFQGDLADPSLDLLTEVLDKLLAKKPADVREHLKQQQATLSYIAEKSEESITSARDCRYARRRV